MLHRSGDKLVKCHNSSSESLSILDHPWGAYIVDGLDLFWFSFHPPVRNHKSKEHARSHPESIFSRIQLHLILLKGGEDFLKVIDVDFGYLAFDKHVVYVHLHISLDLVHKNFIHKALISGYHIFKTK